jgi:hypothetical protein
MRLTLRTLLAWLDDTLQPGQVRAIGIQVAESPFAQELAERIRRVTRQRRLSVPGGSKPDAADPNVVASYLDNDLDPDGVAEYEKKCLTSDVNLAEVASVHQILSLLGQKVRVPTEARARMYTLVKGRESLLPQRAESRHPQPPEPITKPIAAWVVPEDARRSWVERHWQLAAGVLLLAIAAWSFWRSLLPEPALKLPSSVQLAKAIGAGGAAGGQPGHPNAAPTGSYEGPEASAVPEVAHDTAAAGEPDTATAASAPGEGKKTAAPEEATAAAGASGSSIATKSREPADVPAGSSGLAEAFDGVLLKYDPEQREWTRLSGATPLARGDRLLTLTPFRAPITLGKTRIVLVGETEIHILSQPSDQVPWVDLVRGRILLRELGSASLKVGLEPRTLTVEVAPSSSVGLDRINRVRWGSGQNVTEVSPVFVYCSQGRVSLSVDDQRETLTAPHLAVVEAEGRFKRTPQEVMPAWVVEAEPRAIEIQLREQFLKMFHPGRPVLTELVAAIEDETPTVKTLAIQALAALGDLSLLTPMLSRKDDPIARRSAADAIREYMGLSPEAAGRAHAQLVQEFGDRTAAVVEKLLVGYTPGEASNPEVFRRLVEMLSLEQESIAVRELALDSLRKMTGRDELGYNADKPEGKGLSAWKDLLIRGELRPALQGSPPR